MKNNEQDINTSCCRAFVLLQNSSDYFSKNYALLCLSFLLLLFLPSTFVTAQPGQPAGPQQQYPYATFSPTIAIIIVLVIAVLFFMGFFSIYIRQCGGAGGASIRQTLSLRSRRAAAASRGLDAEVIETFPMFQYSEVRTLKIGKGALECAVCLNEFEDDETLRLIPRCDHVFHPECIDAWLGSHITCPVCRANLVPLPSESTHIHPPESQLAEPDNTDTQQNGDAVSIVVEEHREREVNDVDCGGQLPARPPQKESVVRNFSFNQNRPPRSSSVRTRLFGKFRSHSTGHSLVHRGENLERFTLRLPEEVRKEMINRTVLKRTGSLATLPRASSSRRGYRTGKVSSSSRGRSYGILERPDRLEVKSDRWVFSTAPPFFSRASSVRSSDVVAYSGEGSTMSRTPRGGLEAVKLSLNCLEPKGSDETSLISSDSARLPV